MMTYVVTEPCIKCKYTECVTVCPVMCFHEGANCLVIDPDECIDCGACVDPCPVSAIYPEEDVPTKWQEYLELNDRYARIWPVISEPKEPLPSAEDFKDVEAKRELLDPTPGLGDVDGDAVTTY